VNSANNVVKNSVIPAENAQKKDFKESLEALLKTTNTAMHIPKYISFSKIRPTIIKTSPIILYHKT